MRVTSQGIVRALAIAILAGTAWNGARADWNVGDPAKWVQMPDMSTAIPGTVTGMDVRNDGYPQPTGFPQSKILADDFLCTTTGPITDVHIWGSWLNDVLPRNAAGAFDPNLVRFKLSFHSDVPVSPTNPYSHPGQELWAAVIEPGTFTARLWGTANEAFYDPNATNTAGGFGAVIGTDTQVWQYNFKNFPKPPFIQLGTTAAPIIYWLDVQAQPLDPNQGIMFGWKTSLDHHFDDAVFADTTIFAGPLVGTPQAPGPVFWNDLVYPVGHPFQGQSIDLAFVITPEPSSFVLIGLGALGLGLFARRKVRSRV